MEMDLCAPDGKAEKKNEAINTTAPIGPRVNKHEVPSGSASGKASSPLKDTDVGEIVAKSKKAAASLWTLLHAKNCRLGVNRCAHPGCAEAKLIFLHLKMCTAGPGAACPTKHKGCDDARKLLAHYSRCRDIRARQAGQNQKQHVCLVCTLVARHAKSILDRSRSTSPRKPNLTKHSISDGKIAIQCNTPGSQFFQPSPCPSDSSPQMMPPPMPRVSENTARRYIRSDSLDSAMPHSQTSFAFRPRAESLDVPHTLSPAIFCKPSLHPYQHHDSPDLGVEVEQRGESSPDMLCEPRPNGRRRSASCSVFSTPSGTPLVFDTILEEEVPVHREENYDDVLNEY